MHTLVPFIISAPKGRSKRPLRRIGKLLHLVNQIGFTIHISTTESDYTLTGRRANGNKIEAFNPILTRKSRTAFITLD